MWCYFLYVLLWCVCVWWLCVFGRMWMCVWCVLVVVCVCLVLWGGCGVIKCWLLMDRNCKCLCDIWCLWVCIVLLCVWWRWKICRWYKCLVCCRCWWVLGWRCRWCMLIGCRMWWVRWSCSARGSNCRSEGWWLRRRWCCCCGISCFILIELRW